MHANRSRVRVAHRERRCTDPLALRDSKGQRLEVHANRTRVRVAHRERRCTDRAPPLALRDSKGLRVRANANRRRVRVAQRERPCTDRAPRVPNPFGQSAVVRTPTPCIAGRRSPNLAPKRMLSCSRSLCTTPKHVLSTSRSLCTTPKHMLSRSRSLCTTPKHVLSRSRSLCTTPKHVLSRPNIAKSGPSADPPPPIHGVTSSRIDTVLVPTAPPSGIARSSASSATDSSLKNARNVSDPGVT